MGNTHFRLMGDEDHPAPSRELKPLAVKELHALSILNQAFLGITISLTGYCLVISKAPTLLSILQNLMVVVPILVSYFAFYHIRSGIVFLIFHAVAIAGPYFYLPLPIAVIHTIIMIPLTVVKMYDALHPIDKPVSDPGLYYLVFYLLTSWANSALHGPKAIGTLSIVGSVVCLLCSAITIYYRELESFIRSNAGQASLPVSQIRRTSRILIGIFLVIATTVIFLLPAGGISYLTTLIHKLLLELLFIILALLFPSVVGDPDAEAPPIPEETERAFEKITSGADQIPPWLYNLLYGISTFLMIVVVIAIIAGILYALYAFVRGFHVLAEPEKTSEYIETSERIQPKKRNRLSAAEKANPTYQIRRLYKRSILHLKKKSQILQTSNTPSQIERDVRMPDSEDRETLHRIYEKARYSRDGVTIEEADQAFLASRSLKSRTKEVLEEEAG